MGKMLLRVFMASIVRKELFYQDNILLRFHNYTYNTSVTLIMKAFVLRRILDFIQNTSENGSQHNTIIIIKVQEYKKFCNMKIFHIVLSLWVTSSVG